jgi:hypothetical protein
MHSRRTGKNQASSHKADGGSHTTGSRDDLNYLFHNYYTIFNFKATVVIPTVLSLEHQEHKYSQIPPASVKSRKSKEKADIAVGSPNDWPAAAKVLSSRRADKRV